MNAISKVWEWITDGIKWFFGYVEEIGGGLFLKLLNSVGLTMVSFDVVLPQLKNYVTQFASGLPAEAMQFLGAVGFGEMMSMILSALTVRYTGKIFFVPTAVADAIQGGAP